MEILSRQTIPGQGVATRPLITDEYIIVALDNSNIYVYETSGKLLHNLQQQNRGVWAAAVFNQVLVSGGKDSDVRLWDLSTG